MIAARSIKKLLLGLLSIHLSRFPGRLAHSSNWLALKLQFQFLQGNPSGLNLAIKMKESPEPALLSKIARRLS